MRTKLVRLDDVTRSILMRSKIEGNNLTLPEQLPRDQYDKVMVAIKAAGGKWNRAKGCHIFPHDVRETLDIKEDTVEVVNVQQTMQSFYTPAALACKLVELSDVVSGDKVLEPSAGKGALLEAVIAHGVFRSDITAVDIDLKVKKTLQLLCGSLVMADFLQLDPVNFPKFDKVVMNPPFSRGDDIKHILHARKFLKPGGTLVAICADGSRQEEFLNPLSTHWEEIPAGTFAASGTQIRTILLRIDN